MIKDDVSYTPDDVYWIDRFIRCLRNHHINTSWSRVKKSLIESHPNGPASPAEQARADALCDSCRLRPKWNNTQFCERCFHDNDNAPWG